MRCFVDTNILMDVFMHRTPFSDPAELMLALGLVGELELWASASQVTDAFYLLSEGGKRSLVGEARRVIKEARKSVHICPVGEREIDAALDSPWEDFEDACVHQCALKVNADAIVTRNKKDYARSSINVFDCDELFDYLKRERGLDYSFVDL